MVVDSAHKSEFLDACLWTHVVTSYNVEELKVALPISELKPSIRVKTILKSLVQSDSIGSELFFVVIFMFLQC